MKKQQKIYKNIVSFILSIIILITNLNLSFAVSDTVYIDSVNDLIKFSKDASLDTYFKDTTIVLSSNIDLSNIQSFSIPTFSGTFDGQG